MDQITIDIHEAIANRDTDALQKSLMDAIKYPDNGALSSLIAAAR